MISSLPSYNEDELKKKKVQTGSESERLFPYVPLPRHPLSVTFKCTWVAARVHGTDSGVVPWRRLSMLVGPTMGLAGLLLAAVFLSAVARPSRLRHQLMHPPDIASYAAFAMSWSLVFSELAVAGNGEDIWFSVGYAGVWAAVATMSAVAILFLVVAAHNRWWPEPFWAPPTVGVGVFAIAGAKAKLPPGLVDAGVVFSMLFSAALVPWVLVRMLRPNAGLAVAQNPSAAVLVRHRNVCFLSQYFGYPSLVSTPSPKR